MKKKRRRYRKIQRGKPRETKKYIEQGVKDINITFLSMAHIITSNPILYEPENVKQEYIQRLKRYIKAGEWNRRKYETSEIDAYEKIIMESKESDQSKGIAYYKYYILMDLMHVLGYEIKYTDNLKIETVKRKYYADFCQASVNHGFVDRFFNAFKGTKKERYKKIRTIAKSRLLGEESEYVKLILKNLLFKDSQPEGIMVTATMSAGKSTLINALTGKYICLSQNMACTSKIHTIVNKAYEDGYSYEYDHELVLTAGKDELLNNNEHNLSDSIVVATCFHGELNGHRIIINDSPGVNFSVDQKHKEITQRILKKKNYNLLIYVMNATQLGTTDESEHLAFVKKIAGETPVLFIINKIDAFNIEEEDLWTAIQKQVDFLKETGFENPMVCPVSSKAGYLSKRFETEELSRSERRELYNYVDKFEQMNLPKYYNEKFELIKVEDVDKEEIHLQKTCGLTYIEKIVAILATGGNVNGTDLY